MNGHLGEALSKIDAALEGWRRTMVAHRLTEDHVLRGALYLQEARAEHKSTTEDEVTQ